VIFFGGFGVWGGGGEVEHPPLVCHCLQVTINLFFFSLYLPGSNAIAFHPAEGFYSKHGHLNSCYEVLHTIT